MLLVLGECHTLECSLVTRLAVVNSYSSVMVYRTVPRIMHSNLDSGVYNIFAPICIHVNVIVYV